MIHNYVLRSVRYMIGISDNKMTDLINLGGLDITKADLMNYLKKDGEEGFVFCPDEVMAHFLDSLVILKRGKHESHMSQSIETPVTNNIILKKLRVAFELKEDDMHVILKSAKFTVSKPELSAMFRKVGQANYRTCGDQLLRKFLKGLTLRIIA